MGLSFADQRRAFQALPVKLAGTMSEALPYYHAYVLLRTRPVVEVNAIIDAMSPYGRAQFFEELTTDAWRRLVDGPPQPDALVADAPGVAGPLAPAAAASTT